MPSDVDISEKLKILLNNYRSQLPQRLSEIEALWLSICQQVAAEDEINELYRIVHSLAGSGASFGFSELSKAAKAFELQIKPYSEGGKEFSQNVPGELEESRLFLIKVLTSLSGE